MIIAFWLAPPGILGSGIILAQEVADKLPVYSITGGVLMLAMFLIRRWTKQIDDASVAAAKARTEANESKDLDIAAIRAQNAEERAQRAAELSDVRRDLARFRQAFMRVFKVLSEIEAVSDEDKTKLRELRSAGLDTLFDETPGSGKPRAD